MCQNMIHEAPELSRPRPAILLLSSSLLLAACFGIDSQTVPKSAAPSGLGPLASMTGMLVLEAVMLCSWLMLWLACKSSHHATLFRCTCTAWDAVTGASWQLLTEASVMTLTCCAVLHSLVAIISASIVILLSQHLCACTVRGVCLV